MSKSLIFLSKLLICSFFAKTSDSLRKPMSELPALNNHHSYWSILQPIRNNHHSYWSILQAIRNNHHSNWSTFQSIRNNHHSYWSVLQPIRNNHHFSWLIVQPIRNNHHSYRSIYNKFWPNLVKFKMQIVA